MDRFDLRASLEDRIKRKSIDTVTLREGQAIAIADGVANICNYQMISTDAITIRQE